MSSKAAEKRALAACGLVIERYFDVLEANAVALERLEGLANRELALSLRADCEQSARLLTELVFELGGQPPTQGDLGRVVADAKVAIGELAGDRGVLGALKSNEAGLSTTLEKALLTEGLPPSLRARLNEELALARARVALLDERLEELKDAAHLLS
jgi:hypothetical protein